MSSYLRVHKYKYVNTNYVDTHIIVVPDVVLGNCDFIKFDFDCGQKKVICPESKSALKVNVNEWLGLHSAHDLQ